MAFCTCSACGARYSWGGGGRGRLASQPLVPHRIPDRADGRAPAGWQPPDPIEHLGGISGVSSSVPRSRRNWERACTHELTMPVDIHVTLPPQSLELGMGTKGPLSHRRRTGKDDKQIPGRSLKRVFDPLHHLDRALPSPDPPWPCRARTLKSEILPRVLLRRGQQCVIPD